MLKNKTTKKHDKSGVNIPGRVLFSLDEKTGKKWRVRLWNVGPTLNYDDNGYQLFIDEKSSRSVLSQINGLPAYAIEFNPNQFSHVPMYVNSDVIQGGLAKNIAGFFTDVEWGVSSDGSQGPEAVFEFTDDKVQGTHKQAWDAGIRDFLGFSPDFTRDSQLEEIDGVLMRRLLLKNISSCDIVSSPAAGGKFERMIMESNKKNKGDFLMWEKIQETIVSFLSGRQGGVAKLQQLLTTKEEERIPKAVELMTSEMSIVGQTRPDLIPLFGSVINGLQGDKPDDCISAFKKLSGELEKRADALDDKDKADAAKAVADAKTKEDAAKAKAQADLDKKDGDDKDKKIDALTARLDTADKKEAVGEAKEVVEKANLPEPVKVVASEAVERAVMALHGTTGFNAKVEAAKVVAKFQDMQKQLGVGKDNPDLPEDQRSLFNRISARPSRTDAIVALDAFYQSPITGNNFIKTKDGRTVMASPSILQSFRDITGEDAEQNVRGFMEVTFGGRGYDSGEGNRNFFSRWNRNGRSLMDVTTSSWSNILGDSQMKAVLMAYDSEDQQLWKLVTSRQATVKNTLEQQRYRTGGFGILPTVAEGGVYQPLVAEDKPSEEKATYSLVKKGGLSGQITYEALLQDDMSQIQKFPSLLGFSAIMTKNQLVLETVFAATGTATYDSVTIYHDATHGNKGTTALSPDTLKAGRLAMLEQSQYDNTGAYLGMMNLPKYLWVPTELWDTAYAITGAKDKPQVASAAGGFAAGQYLPGTTIPNFDAQITPIMVAHWIDDNDWYLSGDPRRVPIAEVAHLRTGEAPEIFATLANTGSDSSSDTIEHKIRYWVGVCVLDHRGLYGGIVA